MESGDDRGVGKLSSVSASGVDKRGKVRGRDADGVQDSNVREFCSLAEAIDGRRAYTEQARHRGHREQAVLDPSWTQRFVFLRCGMGDSWIRLCSCPE